MDRRLQAVIGLGCLALAAFPRPAAAASAEAWFTESSATTLDKIASTCPLSGGTIEGRDAYSVHCSFADRGGQAVMFEATRGNSGPRHITIVFTVAGSQGGVTHVEAVARREYQAPNGNNIQSDWTGKKADDFLQYILDETGGKPHI